MVLFTSGASLAAFKVAAFLYHVYGVVVRCAKKQMGRIHARRIVASMTHIHAFGYGAVMDFPRQAMGTNNALLPANTENTITTVRLCTGPNPTGIRLLDILPEAFSQGSNFSCHVTMITQRRGLS